jgi:hypothetical protein
MHGPGGSGPGAGPVLDRPVIIVSSKCSVQLCICANDDDDATRDGRHCGNMRSCTNNNNGRAGWVGNL